MLTQHTYFNLEAYRNPESDKIFTHDLYLPYSQRFLPIDGGGLPTGDIDTIDEGHIMDFHTETKSLGFASDQDEFDEWAGGTEGYNHFWLFDDVPDADTIVLTLSSPWNGIKADLRTDQPGVQIYTMGWSDGSAELKSTQGFGDRTMVTRSSGVAIEPHDYVDGINK